MQNYLNTVFFGRNSYGIEARPRRGWARTSARHNDPADAAFIGRLVNQPTNFSKGWDSTEDKATQTYWQQQLKTRWSAILKNTGVLPVRSARRSTRGHRQVPGPGSRSRTTPGPSTSSR